MQEFVCRSYVNTSLFYIRDLSIGRFGYLCGPRTSPLWMPRDNYSSAPSTGCQESLVITRMPLAQCLEGNTRAISHCFLGSFDGVIAALSSQNLLDRLGAGVFSFDRWGNRHRSVREIAQGPVIHEEPGLDPEGSPSPFPLSAPPPGNVPCGGGRREDGLTLPTGRNSHPWLVLRKLLFVSESEPECVWGTHSC